MSRLKITLAVCLLLVLASGAGWLALRSRRSAEPAHSGVATPALPAARAMVDPSGEAFRALVSAEAGHVTGADIAKQREVLMNRGPASRAALEGGLRSPEPFERLIAFRLLLDLDGWSPQMSAIALQDSFVLARVEAADWLYMTRHFEEWDAFLSLSAKNGVADYAALRPTAQHLRWSGIPTGADMMGLDRGLDRYIRELLRRSDSMASLAAADLSSGAVSAADQQGLLRLLHAANRPDYEALLQGTLARATEDTPMRYEAIWLFSQAFASPASRALLLQHLAANPADPLRPRVEQALTSINEQLALGGDPLSRLDARLAATLQNAPSAEFGSALVALLDEALRHSHVSDVVLLQRAKRAVSAQILDYAAQRRVADIDFLIARTK